jgi:predicted helicase
MSGFTKILEHYRKVAFSERDKGDRFERLIQAYLKTDPKYAYRFKNVWLWNEFPGKLDLGGGDTGIDIVALTVEGDYWAIQCKCFQENAVIDKPAVDSFLSTSSREFKNEELKTVKFSQRLWISTTNKWGPNATEAIKNQSPPVTRINLYDLLEAPVDWEKLDKGIHGDASRTPKKNLRPHQKEALEKTHEHFKAADRGKLIMACGTGKTFNSLRIAENETNGKGLILFLVPSIALLGQTLREWSSDANEPINAICICSDPEISRKKTKNEDTDTFSVVGLALPASTNTKEILHQFQSLKTKSKPGMTVVFSTYQSIAVISEAQKELMKNGFSEFDLIICDEAHRTTGVTLSGEDESAFTKVHDNNFIKARKRLYMTATPRLYSDDTKSKAAQAEAILCSMDDTKLFGEEIYRIGFGAAVEQGLLTDYKVLILTLSDKNVPPAVQKMIADKESEITTDDASKLIGCVNALSKKFLGEQGVLVENDSEPMKKAVAFCQSIAVSKKITATYNTATEAYLKELPPEARSQMVSVSAKHIDGTMTAPERDELLAWLKSDTPDNECRILTNVRCLSEGVDVPSLDAVMFLSARNSQVDVVQSVGRVMRIAPGKKYGYIIIPVVVPSDVEADKALDDNERYKVVWTVLNALRAHDDRFNATVNKIELNKNRPTQILVGMPEYSWENGMPVVADPETPYGSNKDLSKQMALQFEQLQHVIFARMVQKVGDRRYWEQWAKNVAEIAERQCERVSRLIKEDKKHKKAFDEFLKGLQKNINPSIDEDQAIDMLCQHIITKPVFEALFEGYSFVKNNPISVSMQSMLDLLEEQALEKDTETLQKFYDSVKMRASGIDNAEGKQRIIIELYDKFFKTAFPKMVEQLGIVYTPVEVVDFIIHSVNDILKKEFDRELTDENIQILDPFTGTGTFITRLLQSGLIKKKDLQRKYENEIYANEIVLLAYYIAAVNIENAYHDLIGETDYATFEGICLTDTFQLGESEDGEKLFSDMFPQNSKRVQKQKKAPLKVIMGNPPYSVGQKSANDIAQNQKYEVLDGKIADTYAKFSTATLQNSLYNSYMKAFRWSTDRLDKEFGGIVAFVTDGGWIDNNSHDGFRKCIEREFSAIYIFNLRGNAHGSGELRKKEAGNVFGSGSRTSVAITFLVKKPEKTIEKARIFYRDIGDYLTKDEKLIIIKNLKSLNHPDMGLTEIHPNEYGDWISKRNASFESFIPVGDKEDKSSNCFFNPIYGRGLATSRDPWCYNSSKTKLIENIQRTINFFNDQVDEFEVLKRKNPDIKPDQFINTDSTKISWDRAQKNDLQKNKHYSFNESSVYLSLYRPFFKQWCYFNRQLNNCVYKLPSAFPNKEIKTPVICVPGAGGKKELSVLITDCLPDLHVNGDTQAFPLYYYEEKSNKTLQLFENDDKGLLRRDGISDFILERIQSQFGKTVSKEDIFYFTYGLLHSREYAEAFASDLKKMLPRIPIPETVTDFWKFSRAGKMLADLHINYEKVPPYHGVKVTGADKNNFRVEKIRYTDKARKDVIQYNSFIRIEDVPTKAYEYTVGGKSAIDWIVERYKITTDLNSKGEGSGITNDPNDWADEVGNPRYILDLLLSVINVSVQTVDIVNGLPKLEFEKLNQNFKVNI